MNKVNIYDGSKESCVIQKPFSENDALYLQDLFLTAGEHELHVNSAAKGRAIVYEMLNSLHYYQNVACLSLSSIETGSDVTDITKLLLLEDYLVTSENLTLFFLDRFYFDFLWIEETPELLGSDWYRQFQRNLIDFNFQTSIPIIKLKIK